MYCTATLWLCMYLPDATPPPDLSKSAVTFESQMQLYIL